MAEARKIREFWFGIKLPLSAEQLTQRMQIWFGEQPAYLRQRNDDTCRALFEPLVQQALSGELTIWADSPRRRLSLILLLDQFTRNIYRGTSRAFAGDEQALALSLSGLQSSADAALDVAERLFFYMPLQHAETREAQDESVIAFRRLWMDAPEPQKPIFKSALSYAERHRDVIGRFGRFPHRNRTLGRLSTPEEQNYLRSGRQDFSKPRTA